MKALITGISGFVGTYLEEHLREEGFEVVGIVRSKKQYQGESEVGEGDLGDENFLLNFVKTKSPDLVFHLAALTNTTTSFENPSEIIKNNFSITLNLLEVLRKLNLVKTKTLIVGSVQEYGLIRSKDNPVNEETSLKPTSPYALSKLTQDFLGLQYFLSYKLPIVRVRPTNQIGPTQSEEFVVPSFAKQIAEAELGKREPTIRVGNLESIRDFIDVRDMVNALRLAALRGKDGEVYNLGSGNGVSISDILKKLLSLSKVKFTIEKDPSKIRPVDIPKLVVDYSKFKKLTGWKPNYSIDRSLEDILNFWRTNGK